MIVKRVNGVTTYDGYSKVEDIVGYLLSINGVDIENVYFNINTCANAYMLVGIKR